MRFNSIISGFGSDPFITVNNTIACEILFKKKKQKIRAFVWPAFHIVKQFYFSVVAFREPIVAESERRTILFRTKTKKKSTTNFDAANRQN